MVTISGNYAFSITSDLFVDSSGLLADFCFGVGSIFYSISY
jgi:hypothetical protein